MCTSARRLLCLGLGVLALAVSAAPDAGPPPSTQPQTQPVHGLTGYYYAHERLGPKIVRAYSLDPFWMPIPTRGPDATRVDPQIAFGHDAGFVLDGRQQRQWFLPAAAHEAAVIWRGWVRLPAAGTYYFATTSRNGSAVYLNQSRVCLDGELGGYCPTDAFAYPYPDEPGAARNQPRQCYLLPVTVPAPVDLPIEVRYVMENQSSATGFGIDLYWVTPDSPKDAHGKPIAQLVPSEALFIATPPQPRLWPSSPSKVISAHSTMTCDYLYLPIGGDVTATVTMQLRDADGKPVAGKRVRVFTLTSAGEPDDIRQPEQPTDAQGRTSARLRPSAARPYPHTSTIFATVPDELVDVAQQCEIQVVKDTGLSFLPATFAPYCDGERFAIEPKPLRNGQPATFTVPLMNHLQQSTQVYVALTTKEYNIGATDWEQIAQSDRFTLAPAESREVKLTWTPDADANHRCFKVIVWKVGGAQSNARREIFSPAAPTALDSLLLMASPPPAAGDGDKNATPADSRQHNTGVIGKGVNWGAKKVGDFGRGQKIPVAGPVSFSPTKGRFQVDGPGASFNVDGHKVAGVSSSADVGAAPDSDPRGPIFDANYKVTVTGPTGSKSISGHTTVGIDPHVQGLLDPSNPQYPQGRQLRQVEY